MYNSIFDALCKDLMMDQALALLREMIGYIIVLLQMCLLTIS
jgi:pentatricopeptide repeat protein